MARSHQGRLFFAVQDGIFKPLPRILPTENFRRRR